MRFSIIIPAHNSAERICKALDSVKSQTFTDYELIVACDSCSDNTQEVAAAYGAVTVACSHHHDGLTRNEGFVLASGEYILFMDDDDWWAGPDVLQKINDALAADPSIDVLACGFFLGTLGYQGPLDKSGRLLSSVWSKAWKRSRIEGTRFRGMFSVSDSYFCRDMLSKPGIKIGCLNEPVYCNNFLREGSITFHRIKDTLSKRIDMIIPAFNARETLFRALSSVASQSVAPEIDVTVVDDCSTGGGYEEILAAFQPFLSVRVLRLEENVGPGFARQHGIDHTNNPLIAFLDADDALGDALSLKKLREALLVGPLCVMVSGAVQRVGPGGSRFGSRGAEHLPGSVCGKLYRRDFLEEFDIRFLTSRSCEDDGFNLLISLCAGERAWQAKIEDTVYFAFARLDDGPQDRGPVLLPGAALEGFIESRTRAIWEASRRGVPAAAVHREAVRSMYMLYISYQQRLKREPERAEKDLSLCGRFFRDVFLPANDQLQEEEHAQLFTQVMSEACDSGWMTGIIPKQSLQDFIHALSEGDPR